MTIILHSYLRTKLCICYVLLGQVNCVRFNEECTLILSGSVDGSVRVWDIKSRKMEPVQVCACEEFTHPIKSHRFLMP